MTVVAGGIADYTNFEGNSVNILGLKQTLQFEEFPAPPIDVSLFLLLIPAQEEYGQDKLMGIEFGILGQTPMFVAGPSLMVFNGPDDGNSIPLVHLHLRLTNWTFQQAGLYCLRFFSGPEKATVFSSTIGVSRRSIESGD